MASSSLILKKLRQTSCSNYLTISGFLSRPTAAFGTSGILTRSIVPYFRSPVCGGGGGGASMMSRFINTKDFHVHVSRDDSGASSGDASSISSFKRGKNKGGRCSFTVPHGTDALPITVLKTVVFVDSSSISSFKRVVVNVMERICDMLNPRGWSFLELKFDEENLPQVEVDRLLFRMRLEDTNEGVCLNIIMHRVKCHDLKVFVEDNFLMCEGLRTRGKTHDFKFELPKKTYQSSDVKAKLENGVLMVTFANLIKQDLHKMSIEITSDE